MGVANALMVVRRAQQADVGHQAESGRIITALLPRGRIINERRKSPERLYWQLHLPDRAARAWRSSQPDQR